MKIVNQRGYALEIGATGQLVAPGEAAEVDDTLAKSLLEQPANWAKAPKPKPTKSAPVDDGKSEEDE